ncbi:helix-turn-helix domain-containing protein [Gayadomonas joobiniege]|uniref:helix-turn-helix domain-containing protein n=1 Tax=Gayadomonas joobiniege TaxID=1234606 RepID=UPI00037D5525|nr:helix-turn-helix domain-containing protein [Gayadomonas joobiniege]
MDITKVAKKSGVAASTLRYYEERGLIHSIGRQGLRRVFDDNILQRLALIALGQSAGFTLDEIALMLGDQRKPEIDRARLQQKADELDKKIKQLTSMRDGLRHVAVCSAPSHLECPKFRRLMGLAAAGKLKSN